MKEVKAKPKHSHIIIRLMTINNVSIFFVTECNYLGLPTGQLIWELMR